MKTVSALRKFFPLAVAMSAVLAGCGGGGPESSPVLDPVVPQANFNAAAGPSFRVQSGATTPLNCVGPADSTYQWVIESNGDYPIELSAPTSAKTTFVAPIVTTPTNVALACRMTVTRTTAASGNIAAFTTSTTVTSRVVVTVDPLEAPTLVTTIAGNKTATPNSRLSLTANSGWYNNKGALTTGPVIDYYWTLGAGAPTGTILTPTSGSALVDVVIPLQVQSVATFPVTVTTVSGTKTTQATVTVLVDPSGSTSFAIAPLAQSVQSGAVVSIAATKVAGMYYQWSVVDGPTGVTLGGASTSSVGFVAPTVTVATNMTLRVAIGYSPISKDNPGVYFLDSVVTVKP